MKRSRNKGGAKAAIGGVKTGDEPQTILGDGSADSAVTAICRAAKQPTGGNTKQLATGGGMKGRGY